MRVEHDFMLEGNIQTVVPLLKFEMSLSEAAGNPGHYPPLKVVDIFPREEMETSPRRIDARLSLGFRILFRPPSPPSQPPPLAILWQNSNTTRYP